jgi:polysaccharide chain length determinant protein (PEP-CTERM system associated)
VTTSKVLVMSYARAIWRRRWYAALVAWLACIAGWIAVTLLPNIYEAKTRVYIDTDSMLRPLMRGIAADSNVLNLVDLMQRTLLSRPNLQKVVRMADLDLGNGHAADSEDYLIQLRQKITISSEGRNLFTIAYNGPNRDVATKVIQSLLSVFVDSNLGSSRQDMQSARAFIDQQLKSYSQQLDQAEKRIAEFKSKNVGFLPSDGNNYMAKLDSARQDAIKTQVELDDSTQKRDELQKQLDGLPRTVETVSSGSNSAFGPPVSTSVSGDPSVGSTNIASAEPERRLADYQDKLKTMLLSYTEQHPDVVRLKKLIEQTKAEIKAAPASGGATHEAPGVRSTSPNPVYEQVSIQLITLESTIASLKARLQRSQGDVQKLQTLASSVPEVAAEMTKLTRDYDVVRKSYEELLNRREAAKIGNDLETQTQTIQFRIIDPPDAPPTPVAPKRALLISAVLFGAIFAGLAFAFLLANIDDTVKNISELRDLFDIPVLGAISMISLPTQKRRTLYQAVAFAASCVALVVAYAGIMSVILLTGPRVL